MPYLSLTGCLDEREDEASEEGEVICLCSKVWFLPVGEVFPDSNIEEADCTDMNGRRSLVKTRRSGQAERLTSSCQFWVDGRRYFECSMFIRDVRNERSDISKYSK